MKGHLDADVLAEYRAWLITGRRRRAITAHLSGCAECAALDARLDQVSALLAATPAPALPDLVARRLDDVLAAEVQKPIPAERHFVPATRRRALSWAGRLRVRVLAPVAATVAVLAGGGFLLSQVGGVSSSSGPASGSAAEANGGNTRYGTAAGGASFSAAPLGPKHNAETGSGSVVRVVTSDVNYQRATLEAQVADQLRALSTLPTTPATSQVSSCVQGITHGVIPALTEQAHFEGTPAIVIVISQGDSDQVLVAGPRCTATYGDIIGRAVVSPGISAP